MKTFTSGFYWCLKANKEMQTVDVAVLPFCHPSLKLVSNHLLRILPVLPCDSRQCTGRGSHHIHLFPIHGLHSEVLCLNRNENSVNYYQTSLLKYLLPAWKFKESPFEVCFIFYSASFVMQYANYHKEKTLLN